MRIAIARRYYEDDESKVSIARQFGLSRFQVARMLIEARREGLVRIEIGAPGRRDRELSAAVREKTGVEKAVVVTSPSASPHAAVEHVGRALTEEVLATAHEGFRLGVTWSSATVVMSQVLTKLPPCSVVQLGGAIYPPAGMPGSVEVTRKIAQAAGPSGHAYPIYAPLVVADASTADGLRRQPEIAEALTLAASVEAAVLSVGAWQPSASAVYDLLASHEQLEIAKTGVCGEVAGRLFDAEGQFVPTSLDNRVVGLPAGPLTSIPCRITSSVGAFRAEATHAAIRAGLVHTLVIDEALAIALLSHPERP